MKPTRIYFINEGAQLGTCQSQGVPTLIIDTLPGTKQGRFGIAIRSPEVAKAIAAAIGSLAKFAGQLEGFREPKEKKNLKLEFSNQGETR